MRDLTPMMQQYRALKQKHPDSLLFFRLGDFYEMFFEDAECAAKELNITLTAREAGKGNKAPMCGVPYHSANRYLARLLKKGYKVTIAEQMEEAGPGKKLVERDVIRTITPGTVLDDGLLDARKNNYIACLHVSRDGVFTLAFSDISTGELKTTLCRAADKEILINELIRLAPAECLVRDSLKDAPFYSALTSKLASTFTFLDALEFKSGEAGALLEQTRDKKFTELFNEREKNALLDCCGALLSYIARTQKTPSTHFTAITFYALDDVMHLDEATRRNLELTQNLRDGEQKNTVFDALDICRTAPGSRRLRSWLEQPLRRKESISRRHEAAAELLKNFPARDKLREHLSSVYDMERLLSRIVYSTCAPRDLIALKASLSAFPSVHECLQSLTSPLLSQCCAQFDVLDDIRALLSAALKDEPPSGLHEGNLIRDGYSAEVDELRHIAHEGKNLVRDFEQRERERTGIKSLKAGFNNVFGYFIEVTKPHLKRVPPDYIRKQTTANGERFYTQELKSLEGKILGAQEKLSRLEHELFQDVRKKIMDASGRIKTSCDVIATVDVLSAHAEFAQHHHYVKPEITEDGTLAIKNGRHPIVERECRESPFVPNDTLLDARESSLHIITGPNMAGKSTYLRQVALITLLAHAGLFVPAEEARLCLVDSIFTRVGARDELSSGMSTFMVEMTETAYILHHATENSLILLDEVGRGTSTYDGLSIAWAVAEYIYKNVKAKTLFATHYHELTRLAHEHPGVKNYNVAVKEEGDRVIFLRKILEGPIDKSYGIFVARLAGLPSGVLNRARLLLSEFEQKEKLYPRTPESARPSFDAPESLLPNLFQSGARQLALFDNAAHSMLNELKQLSIDTMTPLEALNKLQELKDKAAKKSGGSHAKKK